MSKNTYVGNLSSSITQEEIRQLFEQYGKVNSVDLITDRYSGVPRGFGFVKMADEGARMAITALDKHRVGGRTIRVNEVIPRKISERQPHGDWRGRRDAWINLVPCSPRPNPPLPVTARMLSSRYRTDRSNQHEFIYKYPP